MVTLKTRLMTLCLQPKGDGRFEPVSDRELRQLEDEIGQRLPDDYRWFLKNYGASLFELAVSCPSPSNEELFSFGYFYGSDSSGNGVLGTYEFFEGEFPPGMIPIGEDGMGNMFLLSTEGLGRGNVYFWDHGCSVEMDSPDSLHYSGLDRLASSFTEFVANLRLDPD